MGWRLCRSLEQDQDVLLGWEAQEKSTNASLEAGVGKAD